jgi:hypothetical protein
MSTSLARRIRRICLLPTTYRAVKESVLVKNAEGKDVSQEIIKRIPERHFSTMTTVQFAAERGALIVGARKKRKLSHIDLRQSKTERLPVKSAGAPTPAKKK